MSLPSSAPVILPAPGYTQSLNYMNAVNRDVDVVGENIRLMLHHRGGTAGREAPAESLGGILAQDYNPEASSQRA